MKGVTDTMKTGLILSLAALVSCAHAQTPVISNVVFSDISHSSVHVTFDVAPASFVQLFYGLASGNYIYTSASPFMGQASLSIGGLQPGTTYYFRIKARPNPNDDTNICAINSCGSVEQTVTTLLEPAVHPEGPQKANEYHPAEVDTTGYTIVPMQVSPATGECVAGQNVAAQPGWGGAVAAGDNIVSILAKIRYGTVVEFPQGVTCKVLETNSTFHTGYELPAYPADSNPVHRWVVFRTKVNAASDFPPYGFRTGPTWAGKMAKFEVQIPGFFIGGSPGASNLTGQVFHCYNVNCHHFWFQNLTVCRHNEHISLK